MSRLPFSSLAYALLQAGKIVAIKGAPGFARPVIERAGSKTKTGARLWIVGVDTVKLQLFGRLAQAGSFLL